MKVVFTENIKNDKGDYNYRFELVEYTSSLQPFKYHVSTIINNENIEFRMFKDLDDNWKIEIHKSINLLSYFENQINNILKKNI